MAVAAASDWREAAVRFYDREAEEKSDPRRHRLFVSAYKKLAARMGLGPQARVLDAGCGCGELAGALEGRAGQVTGVDLSPRSLRAASRFHPRSAFLCADFSRLPLPGGQFDAVAAITSVEFCPDKRAVLSEFRRVLKSGGRIYLDVRSADFLLFSLAKPFIPLCIKLGLVAPYPAEGFRDLSLKEWKALVEAEGFRLVSMHRSLWPWNFGPPATRAKNLLIEAVKLLAPVRGHYMVGMVWERAPG